jgi:hypothetical protein
LSVIVSLGATQTLYILPAHGAQSQTTCCQAIGTAFTKLRIEILPKTSALADVLFWIGGNDVLVYKITDWTFTSRRHVRRQLREGRRRQLGSAERRLHQRLQGR